MSGSDGRQLRDLEARLAVEDAEFVVAFRSHSSLMADASQLQVRLRLVGECLLWTTVALVALLLVRGSHAGAAGLCLLLLSALLCRGRVPAVHTTRRHRTSLRHTRHRRPNSRSA